MRGLSSRNNGNLLAKQKGFDYGNRATIMRVARLSGNSEKGARGSEKTH